MLCASSRHCHAGDMDQIVDLQQLLFLLTSSYLLSSCGLLHGRLDWAP